MPFIQTTPVHQAKGAVRAMYQKQQAKFGYVPNYAKVFSHRPELMSLWAELLAGIRREVDPRRFELVTLAAAHASQNSYCSLAHGQALTRFFTSQQIQAMVSEANPDTLSEAETAMMTFAGKVARDASSVTFGEVAILKEQGFSDADIFDIVAVVAARAFFTKLLDGLGTEADPVYLEMDEGLRKSLAVGRPIAFDEPERVDVPLTRN